MENYFKQNTHDNRMPPMPPLLSLKEGLCLIVVGSLALGGLYSSAILAIRFFQS